MLYQEVWRYPCADCDDLTVVTGIQWSDNFEPNGSGKANKGSVWMNTIIFVTNSESENDFINTYLIVIGLKYGSHDVIKKTSKKL